jgi:uracil-DNA glycosylase
VVFTTEQSQNTQECGFCEQQRENRRRSGLSTEKHGIYRLPKDSQPLEAGDPIGDSGPNPCRNDRKKCDGKSKSKGNYNRGVTSAHAALDDFNARMTACQRCSRLREHCANVAAVRRRAYATWEYWGRPVPSFGDPEARIMVLGLAPGAHGSNRTGRPFTGDGSGDFLYPVLHQAGFASQPNATSRDDGMRLRDLWICSVARCAPPANKPTPEELRNCAPWLDEEMTLLKNLRVVVCLGRIAFDGLLAWAIRTGVVSSRRGYDFAHGAEFEFPNGLRAVTSYHPSLQNTNTGKLTRPMFLSVFERAGVLAHAATANSSGKKAS